MIGAMAAFLLSSANLTGADLAASQLPGIFEAACLDGEAKLSPGSAAPITFDALPAELRKDLGKPTSAKIWHLGAGRTFLYLLDYQSAGGANPRVCGLASEDMDYDTAADAVEMRVTGKVSTKTMRTTEWINPAGGYRAIATTAGAFKVLQVNWLTDEQRAALAKVQAVIH